MAGGAVEHCELRVAGLGVELEGLPGLEGTGRSGGLFSGDLE